MVVSAELPTQHNEVIGTTIFKAPKALTLRVGSVKNSEQNNDLVTTNPVYQTAYKIY